MQAQIRNDMAPKNRSVGLSDKLTIFIIILTILSSVVAVTIYVHTIRTDVDELTEQLKRLNNNIEAQQGTLETHTEKLDFIISLDTAIAHRLPERLINSK